MTRGKIQYVDGNLHVYSSIEFNGDMYMFDNGHGKEIINAFHSGQFTNLNAYCEYVERFDVDNFGYKENYGMELVSFDDIYSEVIDYTENYTDYIYLINHSDQALNIKVISGMVQIPPDSVAVIYYNEEVKEIIQRNVALMKNETTGKYTPNVALNGKTILVTGAAGFIGANLCKQFLTNVKDTKIVGIDNMNDYYDVSIKDFRLNELDSYDNFTFIKGSIADKALIDNIFATYKPAVVVNLAAQAGVRYSITNPDVYIEANLIGFYNILEACRHSYDNGETGVEHLVYASSSSVYGSNKKVPYSTDDKVDNPVSLYAATKKSNELLAHAYSKLYNIPSTGLRFFTVYGPAGRPDMAYFSFTNKLIKGDTIEIFNYGNCKRDFTYVDDIVEGVKRVMQHAPEKAVGEDGLPLPPYAVYNIGNSNPENLLDFVTILQEELIRAKVLPEDYDFEAHKKLVPMQPGDVPVTYADTSALERDLGFKPSTSLREGLRKFAEWYYDFYIKG